MSSARNLLSRPPRRDEATILFLDIREFSALFDQHDPMDVLHFANSVLSELAMVVEACGGVVDKFTGDGFLAHFGVLENTTNHVQDACWCAIRIRSSVVKLNLQRFFADQPVIAIGIGIHTGLVASGVISTSMKKEFTVLGAVVNQAARIESLTRDFVVDCLVSEAVYHACAKHFLFQKMPGRAMRGIRSSQPTYWLLPTNRFI